jgi:hypothetical protein
MRPQNVSHVVLGIALVLGVSAAASAQYGGSGGTMGGSSGTSSGTYTAPKGGYSSATGAAIGAAAAGGAVVAILLLRNRGTMVGCLEQSAGQTKLVNEKSQKTYLLEGAPASLKTGDRVKLKGKKLASRSGESSFEATKLVKDYGPCRRQAALNGSGTAAALRKFF